MSCSGQYSVGSPSSAIGAGAAAGMNSPSRVEHPLGLGAARGGGKISRGKGTKLSERSGTLADDPFSGRHPTSHERLTGLPWDASYHDGPAPWDIGPPPPPHKQVGGPRGLAGAAAR